MNGGKGVIVAGNMVTAYGPGTGVCWKGLMSGQTAIRPFDRFDTGLFQSRHAGIVPGLTRDEDGSIVMRMLRMLFKKNERAIPQDALLLLATTVGEIDYLEQAVLGGREAKPEESRLVCLLGKVEALAGVTPPGMVVSAACSSSSAAVAQGAAMIQSGERDCVLVVACDSVSEFVFSGFSALFALDPEPAAPFDQNRKGLSAGEAAGFVLLMSEARALKEQWEIQGEIAGWGLSNDASHMTGPSREGLGLARAIEEALKKAEIPSSGVAGISAHGTGTPYNDAMEMKAFKSVFGTRAVPTYSIKGGIGHTMGAAGLIEILIALQSLKEKKVPPTVGLKEVDADARGWVSREACLFEGNSILLTNSGFGGVNAALVLRA